MEWLRWGLQRSILKIYLSQNANDNIRLSEDYQKKLKKGDPYAMITKSKKKFEKSIIIGGGICFIGLGNLFLLKGIQNAFS